MSNIISVESKSATLPSKQAKALRAFNADSFLHSLIFREGIKTDSTITPSMIGLNDSTARVAMGAAMEPKAYITSLAWSVAAMAHGQKKLQALCDGLPSASVHALTFASGLFKHGAGISASSLETVVIKSLESMLALAPSAKRAIEDPTAIASRKEAAEKEAAEKAAAEKEAAEKEAAEKAAAEKAAAEKEAAEKAAAEKAAAEKAAAEQAAAEQAAAEQAAAEQAAAEQAAAEPDVIRCFNALNRPDAESSLRIMASSMGYRLVKIKAA